MIGYTGYTYSMNPARIHWCWLNWMAKSTSEPNPWNDINLNSIHIELCVSLSQELVFYVYVNLHI